MSLAGTPGMWSVDGGSYKVAEQLVKLSGARVLKSKVVKVSNVTKDPPEPFFTIETADGQTKEYDCSGVSISFGTRADNSAVFRLRQ